jgi:hypothetical protein
MKVVTMSTIDRFIQICRERVEANISSYELDTYYDRVYEEDYDKEWFIRRDYDDIINEFKHAPYDLIWRIIHLHPRAKTALSNAPYFSRIYNMCVLREYPEDISKDILYSNIRMLVSKNAINSLPLTLQHDVGFYNVIVLQKFIVTVVTSSICLYDKNNLSRLASYELYKIDPRLKASNVRVYICDKDRFVLVDYVANCCYLFNSDMFSHYSLYWDEVMNFPHCVFTNIHNRMGMVIDVITDSDRIPVDSFRRVNARRCEFKAGNRYLVSFERTLTDYDGDVYMCYYDALEQHTELYGKYDIVIMPGDNRFTYIMYKSCKDIYLFENAEAELIGLDKLHVWDATGKHSFFNITENVVICHETIYIKNRIIHKSIAHVIYHCSQYWVYTTDRGSIYMLMFGSDGDCQRYHVADEFYFLKYYDGVMFFAIPQGSSYIQAVTGVHVI